MLKLKLKLVLIIIIIIIIMPLLRSMSRASMIYTINLLFVHSISHTGAFTRTIAWPFPRTSTVRKEENRIRGGDATSGCSTFSSCE